MAETVLDASALLALLNDEPGSAAVEAALAEALICSVNLSETAAVLADIGLAAPEVRTILADLGLRTAAFDDDLAFRAAELRPTTRAMGLSLGDRACLALAQREGLPALTADRSWSRLDIGIAVRQIR